jgi:hypothetical protein
MIKSRFQLFEISFQYISSNIGKALPNPQLNELQAMPFNQKK